MGEQPIHAVSVDDVPMLIQSIYGALASLGAEGSSAAAAPEPAVSVRSSVKRDHVVCLEDAKKMKMLKRHPMVAPAYAEKRRDLAKKIRLGRKPRRKRGRGRKAN